MQEALRAVDITNFRDIGGYETESGAKVKMSCFYRSAPIVFRSEENRAAFGKLGMRTILDLRSAQEREAMPDEPVPGCTYLPCSAIPEESEAGGNFDLAEMMRTGDLSRLTGYVESIYRMQPFGNPAYQRLFELMLRGDVPLVFHCSAGKDRTGFAAYLILKTLGVSDGTIMQDYMLSNVYRRAENERMLAKFPQVAEAEGLLYVKEAYLQSSIDAIADRYRCFTDYIAEEYGMDESKVAQLREKYLLQH